MKTFGHLLFHLTTHCSLLSAFLLLSSPSVVSAQWEPDVRLTFNPDSSRTYCNKCITAGPNGLVQVAWDDHRAGNFEIYYKRSSDYGVTWSPDTRLTYAPIHSVRPSIASSGLVTHVVWEDDRLGNNNIEIYYKRSLDGGVSWYPDTRLTYAPSWSTRPVIAETDSILHVSWSDSRDTINSEEIYYIKSTNMGLTWLPEVRLTYGTTSSSCPSITATNANVHVTWHTSRDGNLEIYYKRSSDAGVTWSPDTRLTYDSGWSTGPSIASAGSYVYLVWVEGVGNEKIFYKCSTDSGVSWGPDMRLESSPARAGWPSLCTDGGHVHVVWVDNRDVNWELYYKYSTDAGVTWSSDTRLTFASNTSSEPSISASDSMLHIVWTDYRDTSIFDVGEVYYKRNPKGNVGVTDNSPFCSVPYASRFTVFPNPFNSFTAVPNHSSELFTLYDISGRKVGTYRGDRVGEGLSAGVYFLKPEGQVGKPLRILKLR